MSARFQIVATAEGERASGKTTFLRELESWLAERGFRVVRTHDGTNRGGVREEVIHFARGDRR